ncbi:MAG TPA: hypothetical protein VHY08_22905 [Bacillota bacterium]|nr:hypothetical protein [Bacillota bacterium]
MEPSKEIQTESNYASDNDPEKINKELPVKWLKFFTYIRIPFGIITMLFQVFASMNLLIIGINLVYCSFGGLVAFGLHKRRFWGWILALILVVSEAFLLPLDTYITYPNVSFYGRYVVIILVIWSLPNIIYFNKRKYMFN